MPIILYMAVSTLFVTTASTETLNGTSLCVTVLGTILGATPPQRCDYVWLPKQSHCIISYHYSLDYIITIIVIYVYITVCMYYMYVYIYNIYI